MCGSVEVLNKARDSEHDALDPVFCKISGGVCETWKFTEINKIHNNQERGNSIVCVGLRYLLYCLFLMC